MGTDHDAWDGESMSMEIFTDANEEDIDEDVRPPFLSTPSLIICCCWPCADGRLPPRHPNPPHPQSLALQTPPRAGARVLRRTAARAPSTSPVPPLPIRVAIPECSASGCGAVRVWGETMASDWVAGTGDRGKAGGFDLGVEG
jgi:hypothetical protein